MKCAYLVCIVAFISGCVSGKHVSKQKKDAIEFLRLLPRPKKTSHFCQKVRKRTNYLMELLFPERRSSIERRSKNWKQLALELKRLRKRAKCNYRSNRAELFHMSGMVLARIAQREAILDKTDCHTTKKVFFCKINESELLRAIYIMKQAKRFYFIASLHRRQQDSRRNAEKAPMKKASTWIATFDSTVKCLMSQTKTCYMRTNLAKTLHSTNF